MDIARQPIHNRCILKQNLLSNIRQVERTMFIHCNAGSAETNVVGDLGNYGEAWYHPNGIANILSLAKVKKKFRLTFDSSDRKMHLPYGRMMAIRKFLNNLRQGCTT